MIKDVLNSIANSKNAGESSLTGKAKGVTNEDPKTSFFGKMLQALQAEEGEGNNGKQSEGSLLNNANTNTTADGEAKHALVNNENKTAETPALQADGNEEESVSPEAAIATAEGESALAEDKATLSLVKSATNKEETKGEGEQGELTESPIKLTVLKTTESEKGTVTTPSDNTAEKASGENIETRENDIKPANATPLATENGKLAGLNNELGVQEITEESTTKNSVAKTTSSGAEDSQQIKVNAEGKEVAGLQASEKPALDPVKINQTQTTETSNSSAGLGAQQDKAKQEVGNVASPKQASAPAASTMVESGTSTPLSNEENKTGTQNAAAQTATTATTGTTVPASESQPTGTDQKQTVPADAPEKTENIEESTGQGRSERTQQERNASPFVRRAGIPQQSDSPVLKGTDQTGNTEEANTRKQAVANARAAREGDAGINIQQMATQKAGQKNSELAAGFEMSKFRDLQEKRKGGNQESEVRHPLTNERLAAITNTSEGGSSSSSGQRQSPMYTSATEWLRLQNSGQYSSTSASNQEMFFKEQMTDAIEQKDSTQKEQVQANFGHNRLADLAIPNNMLRRSVLPGLTAAVQKAAQNEGGTGAGWQKHSFDMDDGSKIDLSTRNVDGVMQVKLASSSIELTRLLQQYGEEIKEHLEKECELNIDLQFEGKDDQQTSGFAGDSSSNGAGQGRGLNNGNGGSNRISNQQADHNLQQSVRKFGYNRMEWTA
ncbi:hypothetical protein [Gracilimonas mengyeensis]|uniref:Hook-length control protein FliK n=1 Tax=Gracilimonas mengyeensis TaxID=1302730 RepID=A0A521EEK1_9BACT|nr:hypothetical protein [Gracilimonas mengyeensis]SMO81600.1 hypothetical protein SAMN06265219_111108 [Gracilimonas mengyeensis]